ncbi:MAG: CHRD domain-containing protein [Acidobacteria bacterium]|nr:CHRD domain-containing protein [Acidobacteriota bacterium]
MKRICLILMVLVMAVPAFAQEFTATLTGAAEVGGGDPDGFGRANIVIEGTTIHFELFVLYIEPPTMAHIHEGPAGVNGPIVVDFMPNFDGSTATGSVTASQSVIDRILANPSSFYVNVHNVPFPGGAIRGQLEGGVSETLIFPIVGSTEGVNNTRFVTDLRIVNPTDSPVAVTIEMFEASSDGIPVPTATENITILPNVQAAFDDVTGDFLGQPGKAGALVLHADGDIAAHVRVINDQRGINEGTAGISLRGQAPSEAKTSGVLPLLSQASAADRGLGLGFRTNIGFYNPADTSGQIRFTAHAANGTMIGTAVVEVGPYQQTQKGVFDMIDTVMEGNRVQDDFYVIWEASTPVFVYGTTVDNTTGDSVFVD